VAPHLPDHQRLPVTTRLPGTRRECPIGGELYSCSRTVKAGHLMCPYHWRQVPKNLQSDVWRTWRKFNRTHADDDWKAYLEARLAAITEVERINRGRH